MKVQGFPAATQQSLLRVLEETAREDSTLKISPRGFTHVLSVVRIGNPRGCKKETNDQTTKGAPGSFLWGLSKAADQVPGIETDQEGDGAVSRAYYKLEEALNRYTDQALLQKFFRSGPLVALDCGAAPGGWTKCLLEMTPCKNIYSVDPGQLHPQVAIMPGVNHVQMKLEDALPQLRESGFKVDIWVSDMCLHNMSDQVDILLSSRCILSATTLLVLTLKCVVGHSQDAYDAQVEQEVQRLKTASGIEVTHLFSNRSGERTVMGFLHQDES